MEKSSNVERARQFMPFAALRGFEELIQRESASPTPRRELSDYEAELLSKKMRRVEKGLLVRVTYYKTDSYVTLDGMVSEIDFTMRHFRVIKTVIPFDDVLDIEITSV